MASLNKVFLMGNVTRDPELRQAGAGSVCSFGIAVNRQFTSVRGETREEVCFVEIEAWGRTAENVAQYLRKGSPVFVEGRLRYDQWDDRETGKKRSRLTVSAERVQFLGTPQNGNAQPGAYAQDGGYAAPQGGYTAPQGGRPQYQQRPPASSYQAAPSSSPAPQYGQSVSQPPAGGSMPEFEGLPDAQTGDEIPF